MTEATKSNIISTTRFTKHPFCFSEQLLAKLSNLNENSENKAEKMLISCIQNISYVENAIAGTALLLTSTLHCC